MSGLHGYVNLKFIDFSWGISSAYYYELVDVLTKSAAVLKRLIGLRPSVIKVDLIPRAWRSWT